MQRSCYASRQLRNWQAPHAPGVGPVSHSRDISGLRHKHSKCLCSGICNRSAAGTSMKHCGHAKVEEAAHCPIRATLLPSLARKWFVGLKTDSSLSATEPQTATDLAAATVPLGAVHSALMQPGCHSAKLANCADRVRFSPCKDFGSKAPYPDASAAPPASSPECCSIGSDASETFAPADCDLR